MEFIRIVEGCAVPRHNDGFVNISRLYGSSWEMIGKALTVVGYACDPISRVESLGEGLGFCSAFGKGDLGEY